MNILVVLALSLACANAWLAPYAYNGYAGYAGYGYPGYAHAGYAYPGYAPYHAVAAPIEVEEKAVEVAVAPYAHVAAPYAYAPYAAAPAYAPTYASQYHSQDEYGQASYGYAQPGQAKSEVRDAYGNVAGSYYYINPEGKRVEVSYTAGVDGFKVHSNDLPVAPVADLELPVAPVYDGVAPVAPVYTGVAPEPVQDTPEVAAAKAAHLELLAAAGDRKKRSIGHLGHHALGFGYSFGYPAYAHGYAHHALPLAHHAVVAEHHTYAAPVHHGYAAPVHHGYAAPVHHGYAAHHATYAAPAVVGREATLTKVILNPGHAEAYRVD